MAILSSRKTYFFLALLISATLQAASVDAFWARYAKREIPVDSAKLRWQEAERIKDAKKVRLLYNVDFATYFDNREYREPYQIPQTIFAFRLSPTVGVGMNDALGGKHQLIAGVHYTQPMGANWKEVQVDPTAYYRYQYKGFDLNMGMIPYVNRYAVLPDWLMYDSIAYRHPNMLGALLAYHDHRGYVEFMCDWRGMQTPNRREMFRLVVDGQYQYKWFNIGAFGQMNHKANFADTTLHQHEGVCDDILVEPYIGFNVTQYTPFDSLAIRAGYIVGLQRWRKPNLSSIPQGLYIELYANWWFVGLKNTFYYGSNLMPYYSEFGADLNQGDPFFQSRLYNRTDIFLYLYRSSFVNFYFSWNMHYDGQSLNHQQQLIVRFSLDGLKSDQPLRGLFDK